MKIVKKLMTVMIFILIFSTFGFANKDINYTKDPVNRTKDIYSWIEYNKKNNVSAEIKKIGSNNYIYISKDIKDRDKVMKIKNIRIVKDSVLVEYVYKKVGGSYSSEYTLISIKDKGSYERVIPVLKKEKDLEIKVVENIEYELICPKDYSVDMTNWIKDNINKNKRSDIKEIDNNKYIYLCTKLTNISEEIKINDIYSIQDKIYVNCNVKNNEAIQAFLYQSAIIKIVDFKEDISEVVLNEKPIKKDNVDYKIISDHKVKNEELSKWVEKCLNSKKETALKKINGKTYVFLMKEVPTSGYKINIDNIYKKDSILHVDYGANLIDRKAMVLMVISYPYVVIEVDDSEIESVSAPKTNPKIKPITIDIPKIDPVYKF